MTALLGVESTLVKNSPKFASLRTTVPMSIIKQWQLKEHDKLYWTWEVVKGEMILVVRKVRTKSKDRKSEVETPQAIQYNTQQEVTIPLSTALD